MLIVFKKVMNLINSGLPLDLKNLEFDNLDKKPGKNLVKPGV